MSEETTEKPTQCVMADSVEDSMKECEAESRHSSDGEVVVKDHNTGKTNSSNVSEYDSAETYSERENESASGSDSEGSVIFEREEGDGQESTPAKKVDDDEDKKNPQYIPKRGTFYEHDDRTADDIEAPEVDKSDKESKKKVWQDKKEKWNHDRFNDSEQAPKSRTELISIYGYDIRNEDGPPRARRRRRYGRGPNKYTRNWEDEDAYGKPTVIRKTTKKPRSRNPNEESDEKSNQQSTESSRSDITQEHIEEKEQRIPDDLNEDKKIEPPTPPLEQRDIIIPKQNISSYQMEKQASNRGTRFGTGRISKPKREVTDSDYRGFTKSRQFKSSPNPRVHGRNNSYKPPNQRSKHVQELEQEMSKMSVQDGTNFKSNAKHNSQRQGSVPPRLQAEQKGSKRYSSIRQRSLPETANPPFPQHTNYYGNEFNQQNPTSQPPPPAMIATSPLHPPNAPQLPQQIPPQTLPPIPTQVPVTTAPILQAPPQFAPPFTPAPPFLPPGVPPTSFIPQQTGPILNYVPSQPQFPQYQGFQQPFNAVTPPTELYQPQGGITYYSAQEQQAAQRAAPPKRPKAAIPIVAPPEHRGRGRSLNMVDPSLNIDSDINQLEIVGNPSMYEDVETAAQ